MIGKLVVGVTEIDIDSLELVEGVLRVHATMGQDREGSLSGYVRIEGSDGFTVWKSVHRVELGTKPLVGPSGHTSTWYIQYDADVIDRSKVHVRTVFDPPR